MGSPLADLTDYLPLIFVDSELLIIAKPAGLSTLVEGWEPKAPFLVSILKQYYDPLYVVHRLDKDTSGVMVFARTAEAHRHLNAQFETHQIEKIYHGLVHGEPIWQEKFVSLKLRQNADRRHRTRVDPKNGKPSLTHFRVLERFNAFALLQAVPQTGRPHQIRAHLCALGYPVVADHLYGGSPAAGLKRNGLHAFSLRFVHPATGKSIQFQAPYPTDFESALVSLRAP